MPGCCSTYERAANQQFNEKKVAQELKRYRDKGAGPTTRLLEEGIARSGALTGTLIDVGAGLGALTFALLERGATGAVAVDASMAYIDAARGEAHRRGLAGSIRFVHADFVAAAAEVPPATVVTLDRVICCYPSCERLLETALARAERCLALSYPRDVWYVRAAMALENAQRRLARAVFRTFVHPLAVVERTIQRGGFVLASRRETLMWSVDIYVRPPRA